MKKMIVLIMVVLLMVFMIQVVFADPPGPVPNSCHMAAAWWDPDTGDTGPGNANGVEPGERGMYHVHNKDMPDQVGDNGYTYGAQHMDIICP